MARVKRAVAGRKKRQTLVERTKGYYGTSSRTFRGMKEQAQHSGQYAYRDRRNKKRDFRALWIQRINAAARINDLSYSKFMHGLKLAGVERLLTLTSRASQILQRSLRRLSLSNLGLRLQPSDFFAAR